MAMKKNIPVLITLVAFVLLGLLRLLFPERPMEYTGQRALLDLAFALALSAFVVSITAALSHRLMRWVAELVLGSHELFAPERH